MTENEIKLEGLKQVQNSPIDLNSTGETVTEVRDTANGKIYKLEFRWSNTILGGQTTSGWLFNQFCKSRRRSNRPPFFNVDLNSG